MAPDTASQLDPFLMSLWSFKDLPGVFNPWRHVDPEHDLGVASPDTRVENLRHYLAERIGVARLVLCGEALGYQGGHFSGIPMTSERMLIGNLTQGGIAPSDIFRGAGERRCRMSRVGPAPLLGFNEPTATVVWEAIKQHARSTRDVVLWNAFAFHPMLRATDGTDRWLTNRKPTRAELAAGLPVLADFLALFPGVPVAAVGRVAETALARLGIAPTATLRHPAFGGATAFRSGVAALCS